MIAALAFVLFAVVTDKQTGAEVERRLRLPDSAAQCERWMAEERDSFFARYPGTRHQLRAWCEEVQGENV